LGQFACDNKVGGDVLDTGTAVEDGIIDDVSGEGEGEGERVDADDDGFTESEGDCDDADDTVFPGADEYCDEVDRDCDGDSVDGAVDSSSWWDDSDEDGFGGESLGLLCEAPAGAVGNGDDCDDSLARVNPDADEICDGIDTDCHATTGEDGMASFADSAGTWTDVTELVDGAIGACDTYVLDETGKLAFCAGTWYTRIVVDEDLDVSVVGLSTGEDTILHGQDQYRLIEMSAGNSLTVANIKLLEGYARGESIEGSGGCIYVFDGALSMSEVDISGCNADEAGGAVYGFRGVSIAVSDAAIEKSMIGGDGGGICVGSSGSLDIENSTLNNNRAVNGGAVFAYSMVPVSVVNSLVSSNVATGNGGGIYDLGAFIALDGVDIDSNYGAYGGGLFTETGTLMVNGSTISNNSGVAMGGGVFIDDVAEDSVIDFVSTSISDNLLSGWSMGGGMHVQSRSEMSLDAVIFSGNQAAIGGGLSFGAGALYTTDTFFEDNRCRGRRALCPIR
jgi:hypothetical protein